MDLVTLRLLEGRLRERRETLCRQLVPCGEQTRVDPLEKLWMRAARSQLREIDQALERLGGGGFGVCQRCGQGISAERLYAVPWARKCFRCQTAEPHERTSLLRYGAVPSFWC